MKISTNMSGVSAGRFGMLTWKVIIPASSLETTMLVMSGALTSSPIESGKVVVFEPAREESPEAIEGTAARATPRTNRSSKRRFTERTLPLLARRSDVFRLGRRILRLFGNAGGAEPRLVLRSRQRHVGLLPRRLVLFGRRAAAVL